MALPIFPDKIAGSIAVPPWLTGASHRLRQLGWPRRTGAAGGDCGEAPLVAGAAAMAQMDDVLFGKGQREKFFKMKDPAEVRGLASPATAAAPLPRLGRTRSMCGGGGLPACWTAFSCAASCAARLSAAPARQARSSSAAANRPSLRAARVTSGAAPMHCGGQRGSRRAGGGRRLDGLLPSNSNRCGASN